MKATKRRTWLTIPVRKRSFIRGGQDSRQDGEVEVLQDLADDGGIGQKGDDSHLPMSARSVAGEASDSGAEVWKVTCGTSPR